MIRYDGRLYHTVSTTADLTLRIVFEGGGRAKLSTDAEGNLYVDINNVGLDKLCVRDEKFRLLAEKVSLSKSTTFYIGYAK